MMQRSVPRSHSAATCQRLAQSAFSNKSQTRPWLAAAARHASTCDLPLPVEVPGILGGATWNGWRHPPGRTRGQLVQAVPQTGPSSVPFACTQPRSLVQTRSGNASGSACLARRGPGAVAHSSSSCSNSSRLAPRATGDAGCGGSTAATPPLHYAVIGGGLAGLSTAWHLIVSATVIFMMAAGTACCRTGARVRHPARCRGCS